MQKSKKVIDSFNCAIEGIIEALRNESHMRIHFVITVIVIVVSLFMDLNKIEIALLAIATSLVWIAEIINTAVEALVDMYIQEYHDLAKLAKDTAAGAVFVAAVNAVIIGYLVFYNHFEMFSNTVIDRIKRSPIHLSVLILILVVIVVVGLKAYFRKGTPLRGGMPSGHSAVAFAAWVSIFSITKDVYIIIISLLLALLVAQTRVKAGVHSFQEVLVGALVGGGIAFLLFSLLNVF